MKNSKKIGLTAPRGVRANNPLNIEISSANNWRGKVTPSIDKRFETFSDSKYGFRAGAVTLRNYQSLYGLYTLNEILNRFAPPNENKTDNYAKFVGDQVGVGVNESIDLQDGETLARVLHAMSIMEVGRGYYTLDDARKGVAIA
ncbi:structural protein [Vibrio cincinnatiensis]|uniref:structural protein n=1 Tax=Vibrio cincinnatiensis TaxID=675 RepID=UPI001EDE77B9|nr:structural protein [Vibrio cincinnatiensis]